MLRIALLILLLTAPAAAFAGVPPSVPQTDWSRHDTAFTHADRSTKVSISIAHSDRSIRRRVRGRHLRLRCGGGRAAFFWPRHKRRVTVRLNKPVTLDSKSCALRARSGRLIDSANIEPKGGGGPGHGRAAARQPPPR